MQVYGMFVWKSSTAMSLQRNQELSSDLAIDGFHYIHCGKKTDFSEKKYRDQGSR